MNLSEYEPLQGVRLADVKRMLPYAGAALILYGMLRRSPLSVLLAALGGGLIYEGVRNGNWNGERYEKGMPTQQTISHGHGIRVEYALTINRSREDLYRFWRNFENLPRVMQYLDTVHVISPTRSHWVVKAPAGMKVEWDAEIINDIPNERIGWRSLEGADVPNAGSVTFEPGPNGTGTMVRVNLRYDPPGGPIGALIAKLFGTEPEQTVAEDLKRFKSMMEMNEWERMASEGMTG
ncbi:MAG TPA: SRPBCC family protein [Anaerolineae bacterium]|nr:SRPBCC family protein [Anaerolineae bacterium]